MIKKFIFKLIIFLTVLTGILVMCLETYPDLNEKYSTHFHIIDNVCILIYLIEFIYKINDEHLAYFKDIWNLVDFFTLIVSLIDSIIVVSVSFSIESVESALLMESELNQSLILNGKKSNEEISNLSNVFKILKVLRIFRALKALRLLRTIKLLFSLKIILKTCSKSFRSLSAILVLITLTLFNFSVVGCGLFSDLDEKKFGIIEYFIMLNLFIAVLVDNFNLSLENGKINFCLNSSLKRTSKFDKIYS
ncbi:cation channel sperm-associated 1 [Brachionus plicatilis]|uniref:Cation channel sperm-associated 1 n=1 Tax=Brachionus plicatilis TaxID=10195 RepID=A0A3M7PQF8_BRAPC|nr:cation channel sperm-associated 1 [Brachionus plicatilis]